MSEAYRRLTVVGSSGRLDRVLPAHVPLAELVHDLVAMLGEPRTAPAGHLWTLARLHDAQLPLDRTLAQLGIDDGELVYLFDRRQLVPAEGVDDVVEAVQEAVTHHTDHWRPAFTSRVLFGLAGGVTLAASGWSVVAAGAPDRALALLLLGLALGMILLGRVLSRVMHQDVAAGAAAAVAVPLAAGAPVLLLARADATRAVTMMALGLAAWVAVTAVAVPAARNMAFGAAPAVAVVVVVGAATWGRSSFALAALVPLLAILLIGVLPRFALNVSGLAPLDDRALRGDAPRPHDVADRLDSAQRLLSWALLATALASGPGLVALAVSDSLWAKVLAVVLGVVVVLRARSFVLAPQVLPLALVGAVTLFATVAVVIVDLARPPDRTWAGAGIAALVAAALVLAATVRISAAQAARLRWLLDLVERLLLIAAVPLVAGLLGLYREVIDRFS